MKPQNINLYGRVLITGYIRAITGLHIGKGKEGVTIGGVDNPVMRDTLSNEPYIPGSSLKGKMRSLAEKRESSVSFNTNIGRDVTIHTCKDADEYRNCPVCRVYGVPGQQPSSAPTRLIVRDVRLTKASRDKLLGADTDLPFTEVKYEASIDRVTSAANPRPLERVPADSVFGPFEMVFSIYEAGDLGSLKKVFETMRLLEDDYLGGSGSRGSGKIAFEELTITAKPVDKYGQANPTLKASSAKDLDTLFSQLATIVAMIEEEIPVSAKTTPETQQAASEETPAQPAPGSQQQSAQDGEQTEESTHG